MSLQERLASVIEMALREGRADLETLPNGHVCGHVISPEFLDKTFEERRQYLRTIIEASDKLDDSDREKISTLLTYTPDEWSYEPSES